MKTIMAAVIVAMGTGNALPETGVVSSTADVAKTASAILNASQGQTGAVSWGDNTKPPLAPTKTTVVASDAKVASVAAAINRNGSLTGIDRERLGMSISNMRRVTSELIKEGWVDDSCTNMEVSAMVMDRLMQNESQRAETAGEVSAFADPKLNFDSILEFINKLMPIIMAILSLFGM